MASRLESRPRPSPRPYSVRLGWQPGGHRDWVAAAPAAPRRHGAWTTPGPGRTMNEAARPAKGVPASQGALRGLAMSRLLLVDDDPVLILDQVRHALAPQGVQ